MLEFSLLWSIHPTISSFCLAADPSPAQAALAALSGGKIKQFGGKYRFAFMDQLGRAVQDRQGRQASATKYINPTGGSITFVSAACYLSFPFSTIFVTLVTDEVLLAVDVEPPAANELWPRWHKLHQSRREQEAVERQSFGSRPHPSASAAARSSSAVPAVPAAAAVAPVRRVDAAAAGFVARIVLAVRGGFIDSVPFVQTPGMTVDQLCSQLKVLLPASSVVLTTGSGELLLSSALVANASDPLLATAL